MRASAVVAAAAAALAAAGCGGGERQDAAEPRGSYSVEVVRARFPAHEHLAEQTAFVVSVRNRGRETIPDLAVTLRGLTERAEEPGQADPQRDLWLVDEPPRGVTAATDTWTAGALRPGATATLRWIVTPIVAGAHRVEYEVAAGLQGRARAELPDGEQPRAAYTLHVDARPAPARVDPRTGQVIRG